MLDNEDLRRTVKHVLEWVKHVFRKTFRGGFNTLAQGLQEGTISCGICAVNTVAHNLLATRSSLTCNATAGASTISLCLPKNI